MVDTTPKYPTQKDTWPLVDGNKSLGDNKHAALHTLTFNSITALHNFVGLKTDLDGRTGTIAKILSDTAAASSQLATTVGTSADDASKTSLFGSLAKTNDLLGTAADNGSKDTAMGNIKWLRSQVGDPAAPAGVTTLWGSVKDLQGKLSTATSNAALFESVGGVLNIKSATNTTGDFTVRKAGTSAAFRVGAADARFEVDVVFADSVTVPDPTVDGHAANLKTVNTKAAELNALILTRATTSYVNAELAKKAALPGARTITYPAGYGSARSTPKAVSAGQYTTGAGVVGSAHDFTLVWTSGADVNVAVDVTHVGAIQFKALSRRAVKTDLRELGPSRTVGGVEPDVLGFLKAVEVWEYRYLPTVGSAFADTEHLGFIAEDVDRLLPTYDIPKDLVARDQEGEVTGFNDRDLIAVLWQVCKDQQQRIEKLEAAVKP